MFNFGKVHKVCRDRIFQAKVFQLCKQSALKVVDDYEK